MIIFIYRIQFIGNNAINKFDCKEVSDFLSEESNRAIIFLKYAEEYCRTIYDVSWSVLEERIISDELGFYFTPNFYFFETFNRKLIEMFEAGILKWIVDEFMKGFLRERKTKFGRNEHKEDSTNVVLSMDHLAPWFYAFLGLLVIATGIFIVEVFAGIKKKL